MKWKTCPSMLIKLVIIFAITSVVAGSNRFTIPVVTAPVNYQRLRGTGKSKLNYRSTPTGGFKVIHNSRTGTSAKITQYACCNSGEFVELENMSPNVNLKHDVI